MGLVGKKEERILVVDNDKQSADMLVEHLLSRAIGLKPPIQGGKALTGLKPGPSN